jgi:hypothetical protein
MPVNFFSGFFGTKLQCKEVSSVVRDHDRIGFWLLNDGSWRSRVSEQPVSNSGFSDSRYRGRRYFSGLQAQRTVPNRGTSGTVVAVYVSNPDCSSVGINRCDTAPTPTGLVELVRDDFPMYRRRRMPMLLF